MHDGRRGLKKKKKKGGQNPALRSTIAGNPIRFPSFSPFVFFKRVEILRYNRKKKEKKKMVNVSPHSLVCRDALTLPDNTHAPLRNRRGGREVEDEANGGGGGMKGEGAEGRQRESSSGPSPLFFFSFFRG